MDASIWSKTLESFCEEVAGTNPAPAAVAASAVAANLGLGLLIKVLEITARRKSFAGDSEKVRALVDAARRESQELKATADEDIAAVRRYLRSRDSAAVRDAIEVPMRAARAAVAGLELCGEAAEIVRGLPAADLGAAVLLLSAAVRAILLSVDFNLPQLRSEEQYCEGIAEQRRRLDERTERQVAEVLRQVSERV
ncbi:MAG TPA: cyclodeaminase/cyclohydrolase family protein [Bryobacteraceae bacterium]|jgi:formiminotetrahydrofolate cyclodeaminase